MLKILFLGYSSKKTRLLKVLKKKNKVFENRQKKINVQIVKKYDLLISFGYKTIIDPKILKSLKRPAINLHISYLPYNKGAHPNFWSFVEKTPQGVTIHEITRKIDDGKIIARKKIKFKLTKKTTFKQTYKKLILEIEKLFIKNSDKILKGNYKTKKIYNEGTFHYKRDLPKNFNKWDTQILSYLKNLKQIRF